jgi:hypothetical protein
MLWAQCERRAFETVWSRKAHEGEITAGDVARLESTFFSYINNLDELITKIGSEVRSAFQRIIECLELTGVVLVT